jgi:hypothetical protein
MATFGDHLLDNGLSGLDDCDGLYLCSQAPATYAEATATYALGSKASPTIGAAAARSPSGRRRTVAQITDGSVTASGTPTHYALVDSVGERLLLVAALDAAQALVSGNTFSLSALDVGFPATAE